MRTCGTIEAAQEVAEVPLSVVNGVRLYYEVHGERGEPLVFVHGYTGDITDWRLQIAEFSPAYRVLVMDLRGHGRSEAPSDPSSYDVPLMSTDVEEFIDRAGFARYHLVGHSMGGAIAQEIALRSPHKLLSLTLIDTTSKFELPANDVAFQFRAQRLHVAQSEGMAAAAALPLPAVPPHMPPERLKETDERLARMSLDAFVGAARALVAWEGTAERARLIQAPTLIIYGDLDAPALIEGSRRLAELIPKASVAVIAQAAHSPQWERPELFNRALRRHLEANQAPGES
jgi:pimeloyl-ACP methyl ester carboxylesterase